MIAGFEQPSAGDVFIGGERMTGVPAYRRPVNMVFQHYALFPHLDVVADNVSYGLRQRRPGRSRADIDRQRRRGARPGAAERLGRRAGSGNCRAASSSAWRWRAR